MKLQRSNRALVAFLVFTLFVFAIGYVGMKISVEHFQTQKIKLSEELIALGKSHTDFEANMQPLMEESRISALASEKLGLINDNTIIGKIAVSRTKLNNVAMGGGKN